MSITLKQFADRIASLVNTDESLRGEWVTAETSDVRRSGHCYLELVQKHPVTGEIQARLRGTIWRNALGRIDADFEAATGQRLASGMKVMVFASASFHPAYGLSVNITGIDPSYTMGDLLRRRMEIVARLKAEGVLNLNRELEWPEPLQRIAIISAPGAAGYGDFVHQLFTTPSHLRFRAELFPAVMQGAAAPDSIIAALEQIAADESSWDCVVIIRGGGATSDLASFESYELAANIAQFPLPVIIGIGHERDITVLDYVAAMRVKTPTAAAEWLIEQGMTLLNSIDTLAGEIHRTASALLYGSREQLARYSALLPHLPLSAIERASKRMERCLMGVSEIASRRIAPARLKLSTLRANIEAACSMAIERRRTRLTSIAELLEVLSPQATLRRGYSITRVDGHAVTDASVLTPGTRIETTLASGAIASTIDSCTTSAEQDI
ncbi:MAG: exodeoxyribonuclease VII large subunit [Muribaculaceae bacterium]|nr:exodeoxyribonuclease VII large subunit [Muribaculaceae bacterium]